ncbi:MAG TPA: FliH/SctL family protein [Oligoflexia bacterium]|nr:FliH/SctL family protein [Oligoflexia bacterium]
MPGKLDFKIITSDEVGDNAAHEGHNIVTIELPKEQTIHEFDPSHLRDDRNLTYSEHKKNFRELDDQKNLRFSLNRLTRGPLSVEKEEEARIEKEVQRRTKIEIERLKKAELESSQKAGFEKGRLEAKAQVMEDAQPMLQQFDRLIRSLEGAKEEIYKANEDFLMRMTFRLARMVILREIKEDHDYTRRLVTQILERLGTKENIKIFVGPEVFSAAEQLKADLAQTLGQLKNISVELDAEFVNRGCRVETDFGEIDAKIEVQIQNIAKTLGASEVT